MIFEKDGRLEKSTKTFVYKGMRSTLKNERERERERGRSRTAITRHVRG
jgi:hypothetical protein